MTEVSDLYLTVFWWTLGILAVAWVLLAGALIALRARTIALSGSNASRSPFDVAWAMTPAVIVILVAVPAVRGFTADRSAVEMSDRALTPTPAADASGGDPGKMEAEAAAKAALLESELPDACCDPVRLETTTEEDDTEGDDLVN